MRRISEIAECEPVRRGAGEEDRADQSGLERERDRLDGGSGGRGGGRRREAFREASQGGRAFGIATVTSDPALVESFRGKAAALGVEGQYRGMRVTPGDATELVQSPDRVDAALREVVRQSVDQDGAAAVRSALKAIS
ncbi:hypothetical protein [Tsukamurella sp. NPDC003166]|uniref:hypothetical protein n=1 Tax=Tsukamurella sp. NPDC003166 TaxID=3154444 RepID=UPI0033A90781